MGKPRVVVVGRPNVGKSTLVNRLASRRGSIVGPTPGLTRDRVDVDVSWRGRTFSVSDTGGLVESALAHKADSGITEKVANKALSSLALGDLVLFVVDAQTGVTSDDLALVKRLRRVDRPILLVANKADDAVAEASISEMWGLGLGEPLPMSATHGRGSGDLLDRIVELLPEEGDDEAELEIPAIALVGRPNVGKSSIFNKIVGEERALVHHEAGTTRDSIDTIVELEGGTYRFVDTAGIRRRARTTGVEIFSASRTRDAIERSALAILVVDAREGATSQDQRIAQQVAEAGVGAIVALNKWDTIADPSEAASVEQSMSERLHFVDYAQMVRTSALTRRGIEKLLKRINPVLEARMMRIPTAKLNEIVQAAQQRTPIPRHRNRNVKILYATQADTSPPSFVLFTSGPIGPVWLRFLERKIRETLEFEGIPLRFVVRPRERERVQ